ncbi:Lead, cadmium, zinc and mercury transporting ATPase; Copper-translocating P-type ATPase [hydrothermal vent metagenome]|uniref:Lead, cadmium, zinc and mercury transporting ATPase Copper-translocating P-type ATPase n=1 Tax=hydrothermal vent metagenome TaxID=652676 RepID=A0A1W1E244_9ZZZZ
MSNTHQHSAHSCFHCGLESAENSTLPTLIVFDEKRCFCCMGCYSVCQMIVESELDEYYRYRLLDKSKPADVPDFLTKYQIYDQESIQKSFVVDEGDCKEAYLLLENIRCPACVWLNEKHLRSQPGVLEVYIDATSNRARVKWQPKIISLSQILQSIADIGYLAHPYDAKHSRQLTQLKQRRNIEKLLFAGVIGMMLMQFSVATYLTDTVNQQGELLDWVKWGRWGALIGSLGMLVYPAQDFWIGAWQDLRRKQVGMDVPIVLGLSAAFFSSVDSVFNQQGEVYFDSISMFVFFILLARFLEFKARDKSISKLDQLNVAVAQTCEKWNAHSNTWEKIAVIDLQVKDLVKVKPGETVMADGDIVTGASSFDESLLTGESSLIEKIVGDKVIAGAINHDQTIELSITHTGSQTLLSQIGKIATHALEDKPTIASRIDFIARWFVLGVLLVATGTATYWLMQGDQAWLAHTISVLIVTCPCALALATPIALTLGMERYIKQGILPLKMSALESLATINQVAFDKTGTLTTGNLSVLTVELVGNIDEQEAIKLALSLANYSEHVVAQSLVASFDKVALYPITEFENTLGLGVKADIEGTQWHLGRIDKQQKEQLNLSKYPAKTHAALSNHQGVQAVFILEEKIRPWAKTTVEQLQAMGIKNITLLSGDNELSVRKVAHTLGIEKTLSNCLPQDKLTWLQNAQAQGARILFVGDGINDTPILAGANVSITLSSASDMANIHSDFIALNNRLDAITNAINTSKFIKKIIHQNLFWALSYNIVAIPLAAYGLVPPWLAAVGMSLSSLFVVLNALRLQKISHRT